MLILKIPTAIRNTHPSLIYQESITVDIGVNVAIASLYRHSTFPNKHPTL